MAEGGSRRRVVLGRRGMAALLALGVLLATLAPALAQATRATGLPVPRFVSLRSDEVSVRYGPGQQYPIRFVFTRRGLPVKITAEFDTWRRIEDHEGEEGWIHSSLLSSQRTVMIQGGVQALRRTPSAESRVLLRAEPGVIGQLFNCQAGWCLIEIAGRRGWLETGALYGVLPEDRAG